MTEPAAALGAAGGPTDLDDLEVLVRRAQDGDRKALEKVLKAVQQPVYRLALRFTGHPHDAEDATQEVLVHLMTRLGSFEGRSRFTTWVYTVAVRRLLRSRRRPVEASVAGPGPFAAFVDDHQADPGPTPEDSATFDALRADVRLACTYGMLLCLSREQRVAYLVGDLLGFTDVEAAEIAGISRAAHRQRLARARRVMRCLVADRCGLVRQENPCRCPRLARASIEHGLVDPAAPAWAHHAGVDLPLTTDTLERAAAELDLADAAAATYRTDPTFVAPQRLWLSLQEAMPELVGPG